MKKPPFFITEIKSSHKLLLSGEDLTCRNFWEKNDGPLNFFVNLHGKAFLLFIFSSVTGKIIGMFSLLTHIKCLIDIYFIEKQTFPKLVNLHGKAFLLFIFSSVTGKIIGMFSLLTHIKCLIDIYFIEKQTFPKQPFLNYGPSKMVFHFFVFYF